MEDRDRNLLKELLAHQRVLSLAVLVADRPYAGLLPFVVRPDRARSVAPRILAGLTE